MASKKEKIIVNPLMQKLLKQLTESGLQEIDRVKINELVQECRNVPSNVQTAFRILFSQLEKRHAEIRWSSFQVIVILFEHFETFRTCVVDRIKDFVRLVVQYDDDKLLPPPKVVAERLSYEACRTIAQWNEAYGRKYIELELMYKYMENVYKIKFHGPHPAPAAPVSSRQTKIKELQLKKATEELTGKLEQINGNLEEFWSCMKLLMPSPENFDIPLGADVNTTSLGASSSAKYTDSSLREEGYRPGVSVSVVLPQKAAIITENDDNTTVLENLRACYSVCSKHHLPAISGLLEKVSKLGASEDVIKSAIDVKGRLSKAISAFENGRIKWRKSKQNDDDEDDDDDWIEVPPSKNDESISADKLLQQRIIAESKEVKNSDSNADGNDLKDAPTPTIPQLLLAEIPAEDCCQADPAVMPSKEDNIWCNSIDVDVEAGRSTASAMMAEALSTRTYFFVSKEAAKAGSQAGSVSICGFPLGNGKFCPRRDRKKCPFHGPIKSREQPSKDDNKVLEDVPSTSTASWRDPGLERDISAAIGIKLTAPTKSRKRSGLTQLRPNDPKTRIAKKMCTSAERVAEDMNRRDAKRHNDRFAHSFNYSLSRTL